MNNIVDSVSSEDDIRFAVMEGVPSGSHGVMVWSPVRHFRNEDHAGRYAKAMNEREERLRELAYAWHGRAMEVQKSGDEDQSLEAAYPEFLEECQLDGEMKRALSRFLGNDLRANSYVVMSGIVPAPKNPD